MMASAHSIKPSYYKLLEELKAEYDAAAQVERLPGYNWKINTALARTLRYGQA